MKLATFSFFRLIISYTNAAKTLKMDGCVVTSKQKKSVYTTRLSFNGFLGQLDGHANRKHSERTTSIKCV